jgi:hypothetical protein
LKSFHPHEQKGSLLFNHLVNKQLKQYSPRKTRLESALIPPHLRPGFFLKPWGCGIFISVPANTHPDDHTAPNPP